jgi:hypothetical protein
MRRTGLGGLTLALLALAGGGPQPLTAGELADVLPVTGQFPPPGAGIDLAGELVSIDHVNRRGGLRLDGDFDHDRYHRAPTFRFAILPYGSVTYHGAPADLGDIPLGTRLHGRFLLPPEGDSTIPAETSKYVPRHNRALMLEDDASRQARLGEEWLVTKVTLAYDMSSPFYPPRAKQQGAWEKTPCHGEIALESRSPGPDGKPLGVTFSIDRSTRLWRGSESIDWEAAGGAAWKPDPDPKKENLRSWTPGELVVSFNLTWHPDWKNRRFHCLDLWLDAASRELAAARQREAHLRRMKHYWLAGWIDHVKQHPGAGGELTITLFGGADKTLYDDLARQAERGAASVAVAEETLRSWWQDHDKKGGRVLEATWLPDPPPGSSGLVVRIEVSEMLEGYRPGRCVRVHTNPWPNVLLPPEFRVKSLDER